MDTHRVVIIGGGFGGLHAARSLRRAAVQVTLVDRRNFHLFQPLLYQVATGALSAANIAAPLREIFKRQRNVRVLLGEVRDIDLGRRRVVLHDYEIPYDSLIVATGSRHHYFGHEHWEALTPGLKTIEDATEIRRRIFLAFEEAELEPDPSVRRELLTFVVVGGGPTGVELAGALAEIARDTLRHEFRSIDPADAHILLIESGEQVLQQFPGELPAKAAHDLEKVGVVVRTKSVVTDVQPAAITVRSGDMTEVIRARTVLWAAGVKGSPLGAKLAEAAGLQADRSGRVPVEPDLSLAGYPDVFVIGDLAQFSHGAEQPLPGVAQVAMQEGKYVAQRITARLAGKSLRPFEYRDYGSMATIGRSRAVAAIGRLHFTGFVAWLVWLLVHLMNLVQFRSRVLVFLQWAWYYFTWNRGARLITDPTPISVWEAPGVPAGDGRLAAVQAAARGKPLTASRTP